MSCILYTNTSQMSLVRFIFWFDSFSNNNFSYSFLSVSSDNDVVLCSVYWVEKEKLVQRDSSFDIVATNR